MASSESNPLEGEVDVDEFSTGRHNKGNKPFYRRCQKCRYDESVTANTMFHKCKMGLQKAFEGVFLMAVNKKRILAAR